METSVNFSRVPQRAVQAKAAVQEKQLQNANTWSQLLPGAPPITSFTWAIANDAGATQLAVLLNTGTLVTGLTQGANITTTAQNGATYTNQVASFGFGGRQFITTGFDYQVSSITQYQQTFTRYYSNGVGKQDSDPINPYIQKQLQNIPANPNVLTLTIQLPDKIEPGIAYTVNIIASSTQYITWNVVPMSQYITKVT